MIKTSPEALSIRERLFQAILIEDFETSTIREREGRQVYFRTAQDILVRHDIEPNRYYVLNRENSQFIVKPDALPLPLLPDRSRPFTADDLLRDKTWMEWAQQHLVEKVPNAVLGPILGTAAASGLVLISPAGPPILAAAVACGQAGAYLAGMAGSGYLIGDFIERRRGGSGALSAGIVEEWAFGSEAGENDIANS